MLAASFRNRAHHPAPPGVWTLDCALTIADSGSRPTRSSGSLGSNAGASDIRPLPAGLAMGSWQFQALKDENHDSPRSSCEVVVVMVAVAVMHLEGHPSDPAGGAGVAMESEARRRGSPARGDRV